MFRGIAEQEYLHLAILALNSRMAFSFLKCRIIELKRVTFSSHLNKLKDFPGGEWLRFCASSVGVVGSIPDRGMKIPHATQWGQ